MATPQENDHKHIKYAQTDEKARLEPPSTEFGEQNKFLAALVPDVLEDVVDALVPDELERVLDKACEAVYSESRRSVHFDCYLLDTLGTLTHEYICADEEMWCHLPLICHKMTQQSIRMCARIFRTVSARWLACCGVLPTMPGSASASMTWWCVQLCRGSSSAVLCRQGVWEVEGGQAGGGDGESKGLILWGPFSYTNHGS
jgi:hypothetical protein